MNCLYTVPRVYFEVCTAIIIRTQMHNKLKPYISSFYHLQCDRMGVGDNSETFFISKDLKCQETIF